MLLRDRADAEDASQQVFLSAHRALLNGSRPARAGRLARDDRAQRVLGAGRGRACASRSPCRTSSSGAQRLDPLAEAVRRADLADLWRAIAELPQQQRDALLLREFGGLSYEELAAALAVTGPAVESLLFRARQTLRVRLKAAYAALTGASWIETVVRLLAGGSAPVATKAVAIGLGAAALTGGAVVVPRAFQQPVRSRPAVSAGPARAAAPAVPAAAESAARLPGPHRVRAAVAPVVFAAGRPSPAGERQRPEGDGGGGDTASGQAEAAVGGEAGDQSGPTRPLVALPSGDGSSSGGDGGSPQGDSASSSDSSGGAGRDGGSPDGGSGDSGGGDPSGPAEAPPADASGG